ncbi:MAG: hypothetical protein KF805_00560 [Phycisphaeraceae bacterium]|nr:hypothetical protein [Phycisphaeraceae bacterium]
MVRSDAVREDLVPAGTHLPLLPARGRFDPGTPSIALNRAFYRLRPLSWREARFLCIIIAILAMSLADLSMTLIHATSIGMQEENPIARLLMRHGGICSICIWKGGTVAIGVFILWRVRRFRCAEVGAWVCFAILAALCFHWASYNAQISGLTSEVLSLEEAHPAGDWFVMHPDSPR